MFGSYLVSNPGISLCLPGYCAYAHPIYGCTVMNKSLAGRKLQYPQYFLSRDKAE